MRLKLDLKAEPNDAKLKFMIDEIYQDWTFPKKVDTVKSKPLIFRPVRIGLESYSPM